PTGFLSLQGAAHEAVFEGFLVRGDLDDVGAAVEGATKHGFDGARAGGLDDDHVGAFLNGEIVGAQGGHEVYLRVGERDLGADHVGAKELANGAIHHHFAAAENRDVVAERLDVAEDVGGKEDGAA